MILHGFTSNLDSVRELFDPLKNLGLPVVAPLLRGHGEHSPDALQGIGWNDWLLDAEKALRSSSGPEGKLVVVGHSMGALLALHLASSHPALVDSVVLATSPFRLASILSPGRPMHFLAPFVSRLVPRWNLETLYADPDGSIKPSHYQWAPTSAIISFFDLVDETLPLLDAVTVPALIMQCRHDSIVLPESAEILMNGLATPAADKSVVWFETSGHQLFCDCERKTAVASVVDFVSARVAASQHLFPREAFSQP